MYRVVQQITNLIAGHSNKQNAGRSQPNNCSVRIFPWCKKNIEAKKCFKIQLKAKRKKIT